MKRSNENVYYMETERIMHLCVYSNKYYNLMCAPCTCTTQNARIEYAVPTVCVCTFNEWHACRHCNRQLLLNDIICIVCAAGAITAGCRQSMSTALLLRVHSPIKCDSIHRRRMCCSSGTRFGSPISTSNRAR